MNLSTVSKVPNPDYISSMLLGGNAGTGTAHWVNFSFDGTNFSASHYAVTSDIADTGSNCWGQAQSLRIVIPAASSIYVKTSGSYSTNISVQQFQIRR
jgi:hypothetical protein